MKTIVCAILLSVMTAMVLSAQEVVLMWNHQMSYEVDWNSVAQGRDGGFLVVGNRRDTETPFRGAMIRLAADGSLLWDTLFDRGITCESAVAHVGGGYFVVGATAIQTPVLMQLDSSGHIIAMDSTFGTVDTFRTFGHDARSTADGGFVLCGAARGPSSTSSRIVVMKFSAVGVVEWWRVLAQPDSAYGHGIRELTDGGFAVAFWRPLLANTAAVARLSASGDLRWIMTHGNMLDHTADVIQREDGGLIAVGGTNSERGDHLRLLWLADSTGFVERDSLYGERMWSNAEPTRGGGFVVCTEGRLNMYVTKVQENGGFSWQFDLRRAGASYVYDFAALPDGRVLTIAQPTSNVGVVVVLLDDVPSDVDERPALPEWLDLW